MSDFFKQLMQGMRQHYRNQHRDNFDFEIRPHNSPYAVKAEERSALEEELAELLNSGQSALIFPSIHGGDYFLEHIEAFEPMYEMLGDTQSRKRYIEVLLYKILGFTKVKLSLNTPEFWEQRAEIARCKGDLTIEANFPGKLSASIRFEIHRLRCFDVFVSKRHLCGFRAGAVSLPGSCLCREGGYRN